MFLEERIKIGEIRKELEDMSPQERRAFLAGIVKAKEFVDISLEAFKTRGEEDEGFQKIYEQRKPGYYGVIHDLNAVASSLHYKISKME